jgi:hypothetical protein
MSQSETYKNYLRDLIYILKENFQNQSSKTEFDSGIKLQLQNTIDLIENQANAFQIDLNEIGFYEFEKYQNKESDK